jgi:hypothetical protein
MRKLAQIPAPLRHLSGLFAASMAARHRRLSGGRSGRCREGVNARAPRLGHAGGSTRSAGRLAPHAARLPAAHMCLALLLVSFKTSASLGIARAAPHRRASPRRCGLHPRCCAAPRSPVEGLLAASAHRGDQDALLELQRCVRVDELECLAQACEASGDLKGEVAAYEALLAIEPPDAHWVSAATSARRGLQARRLFPHFSLSC